MAAVQHGLSLDCVKGYLSWAAHPKSEHKKIFGTTKNAESEYFEVTTLKHVQKPWPSGCQGVFAIFESKP